VTEVVAGLGGERYLALERVPLDPCGPECTENANTYVLRELARLRPAQDIAAVHLSSPMSATIFT
jgi:hypothetical protein